VLLLRERVFMVLWCCGMNQRFLFFFLAQGGKGRGRNLKRGWGCLVNFGEAMRTGRSLVREREVGQSVFTRNTKLKA